MEVNGDMNQDEGLGCCVVFQPSMFGKKNKEDWRKRMIDELSCLSLDEWPEILIDYLKKTRPTEFDQIYQSDIMWLDKNSSIKRGEYDPNSSNFLEIGKNGFVDNSVMLSKTDLMSESFDKKSEKDSSSDQGSIDLDQSMQNILDSSELLDEDIYAFNNKETWMDKSFDIRFPQETKHLTSNFDNIPRKNNGKTLLKKPENGSKNKQTSKKIGEAYNNNTILNQFSPVSYHGTKTVNGSHDLYNSIMKYKEITSKIESHLKQEKNVFNQLMSLFEKYFIRTYTPVLEMPNQESVILSDIDDYVVRATLDLQQFIRLLFEAVSSFYSLKNLRAGKLPENESLFNRDNMINFITSIVLSQNIYDLIFSLCKKQDFQIEESYQKNIKLCKNLKPEDFGIPDQYCLTEKTIQYFKDKGLMKKTGEVTDIEKKIQPEPQADQEIVCSEDKKEEITLYIEESQSKQQILKKPYEKAIEALKHLKERRSPLHKLKTILKVVEFISIEIEEFYKDFGVVNSKKLDADQTLSICLYVVAKSGIGNITAHCRLIERFSTTNILHSVSGYYATTLEACVNCLCAMQLPQDASTDEISGTIKRHKQSLDLSSDSHSLGA